MLRNIAVLIFTILSTHLFSKDINFRALGIKDGLSHPTVYSIYQDERGTIWFATKQGLNYYDGNRIELASLSPVDENFLSSTIRKVDGDKNEKIFIKSNNRLIVKNIRTGITRFLSNHVVFDFQFVKDHIFALCQHGVVKINVNDGNEELIYAADLRLNENSSIFVSKSGIIWIGTIDRLINFNPIKKEATQFPEKKNVTAIYETEECDIWIGTKGNGVFCLINNKWHQVEGISPDIRCITTDGLGNILVATFDGLYIYSKSDKNIAHYAHTDNDLQSLSHSSVYAIYKDNQNTIWLGTYYGGVCYYCPEREDFRFYSPAGNGIFSSDILVIGNITEDKNNKLWVCTEGRGVYSLNQSTGKTVHYSIENGINRLSHNNVKSVYYDNVTNTIFFGTHTGGVTAIELSSNKTTFYSTEANSPYKLPNDVVNKMAHHDRQLFLLTQGGVATINMDSKRVEPSIFDKVPLANGQGNFGNIFVDSRGRIWLSHFGTGMSMYDIRAGVLKEYSYKPGSPKSIPRNRVVAVFETSHNGLFFTTDGSGIARYNESTDDFDRITREEHNLLSDFCFNITETRKGQLVVTTSNGFSVINPHTYTVNNYLLEDIGPMTGLIEENGLFTNNSGEVLLAGLNGILTFTDKAIEPMGSSNSIYFSHLVVNNEIITPGQDNRILKEDISFTKSIELGHKQANLVFGFASSNFINHHFNSYEYKLEGLDDHWIVTNTSTLRYNNLHPGKYKLMVRDTISDASAQISITIKPPFYASAWAIALYLLMVGGAVAGTILHYRSKANFEASLAIERHEKEQIEQLNQSKLKFFTNLSHEFRTPLTLILAHTDMMSRLNELSQPMVLHISKIKKNAIILRNLINELLDLRKQESGRLKISCQNINMVEFASDAYSSFKEYAVIRNIRYQFEYPQDEIMVWFDPDQMHKVFFNLLSNAFKHTPEGGSITLSLLLKSSTVSISVKDSGFGLTEQELEKVFDPYYQAENMAPGNNVQMGTGIGLSLSKGIVELHGGNISVDSKPGLGTSFKVELLLGDSHLQSKDKAGQVRPDILRASETVLPDSYLADRQKNPVEKANGRPTIVVVEDNEDLLEMLKGLFEPLYNVITASNGEEGLEAVRTHIPDIIVTDDMMPKLKGTEMCQRIKNNSDLAHIPIVLLTVQDDYQRITKALMGGADDYITKPFDAATLLLKCNNMVESRQRLLARVTQQGISTSASVSSNIFEQEFIVKTNEIIARHIDNPAFNVDVLAEELNMSRSKFYSKVKDATGLTPNTYILNHKMDKAMNLLQTQRDLSVSDIAYKLGFSSARYFSLCFKDHFGYPPTEIKNRLRDGDKS